MEHCFGVTPQKEILMLSYSFDAVQFTGSFATVEECRIDALKANTEHKHIYITGTLPWVWEATAKRILRSTYLKEVISQVISETVRPERSVKAVANKKDEMSALLDELKTPLINYLQAHYRVAGKPVALARVNLQAKTKKSDKSLIDE